MNKEKRKKAGVAIIIISFILGIVIGYFANDFTKEKYWYHFDAGENILLNSGFEYEDVNNPIYWIKAMIPAENLTMLYESDEAHSGNRSVSINNTHIYDEEVSNNWFQPINIVPLNRIVELSGWIKTIDAESVVMVIRCEDENDNLVGFGTTKSNFNITGTSEWTKYTALVKVPSETEAIRVLLALTGTGQVWFDDVTLVVK